MFWPVWSVGRNVSSKSSGASRHSRPATPGRSFCKFWKASVGSSRRDAISFAKNGACAVGAVGAKPPCALPQRPAALARHCGATTSRGLIAANWKPWWRTPPAKGAHAARTKKTQPSWEDERCLIVGAESKLNWQDKDYCKTDFN